MDQSSQAAVGSGSKPAEWPAAAAAGQVSLLAFCRYQHNLLRGEPSSQLSKQMLASWVFCAAAAWLCNTTLHCC